MATVSLLAVNKFYGPQCILNDINLTIEKGEFIAVVGPSGCGKSTLLRLIAGLDTVTEGSILINQKCVNKIPAAARDMAMVFQNYALYPHMTAYNNMAYGLKMRGMKKVAIRQRVEEVADLLQLREHLTRLPSSLSGGQRQRVAMGRAIVRSPSVFLFDEPLSNLDAQLRTEMRHEIKKLHRQLNTTCIYVTHDQTEAMTMADRLVILNKGRIEQIGTPQMLYQSPATLFVAGFIGHYPMNFITGVIDPLRQFILTDTGATLVLPKRISSMEGGDGVIVGIRPEHMSISSHLDADSISGTIEFIDDMGADKLVQILSLCGNVRLSVRVSGDTEIKEGKIIVKIDPSKMSLFCKRTGNRL